MPNKSHQERLKRGWGKRNTGHPLLDPEKTTYVRLEVEKTWGRKGRWGTWA